MWQCRGWRLDFRIPRSCFQFWRSRIGLRRRCKVHRLSLYFCRQRASNPVQVPQSHQHPVVIIQVLTSVPSNIKKKKKHRIVNLCYKLGWSLPESTQTWNRRHYRRFQSRWGLGRLSRTSLRQHRKRLCMGPGSWRDEHRSVWWQGQGFVSHKKIKALKAVTLWWNPVYQRNSIYQWHYDALKAVLKTP